ncbi:MAG: hypothetical protein IJV67_02545 [Clostridia bacterium]|nr:hypothetical protein [Clostridia bacterium]
MGNISLIMVLYAVLILEVATLAVLVVRAGIEYRRMRAALKASTRIIELQEKRIRELEENA